jgi:general stress protein 26
MKNKIKLSVEGTKAFCILSIVFLLIASTLQLKAQEKNEAANRDSMIVAAKEIMALQKYCALITLDSDGTPRIRTMNPFPPDENMCVYMATNSNSRKIAEIKKNPNVTLYYSNHAVATGYVSIKGKAVLIDDMAEKQKRKRDYWDQAFPDWKYLILIKVVPEKLEVINYKHKMYNDPNTFKAPTIEFNKQ